MATEVRAKRSRRKRLEVDYRLLSGERSVSFDSDGFQVVRGMPFSLPDKQPPSRDDGKPPAAAPKRRGRNSEARRKVKRMQEINASRPDATTERRPSTYWDRIKNRIRSQLHRARFCNTMLDAYEYDGWRSANREKVRPEGELAKARRDIIKSKLKIREVLREMWTSAQGAEEEKALNAVHFDEDGIDAEQIFCAKCKGFDPDGLDNDILLCDLAGCNKAFHQKCLEPAVSTADIESDPDGDWFCHRCSCLLQCLNLVNEQFDTDFDSWEEVFPDVEDLDSKQGGSNDSAGDAEDSSPTSGTLTLRRSRRRRRATANTASCSLKGDEDSWGSDSDEENWGDGCELSGSAESSSDDDKDEDGGSQDDDSEEDEDPASLILSGKRKRSNVNYVALQATLFGDRPDSDDDDEFTKSSKLTDLDTQTSLTSVGLLG